MPFQSRVHQKRVSQLPKTSYTFDVSVGGKRSLKDVVNDCDLDVRVEAMDCFFAVKDAADVSTYLKLGESDESKTLNSVATFDIADVVNQLGLPVALSSKDLSSNIGYIETLASQNKMGRYGFNVLKVSYKSPCDLAALSFSLDIPDTYIVCPLGIFNTLSGDTNTAVGYNKMVSVTPMGFDTKPFPISTPSLCFVQKDSSSFAPAATDWQDFCYLLVITGSMDQRAEVPVCLEDDYYSVDNIKGFKNEFVGTSLDISSTPMYIDMNSNGKTDSEIIGTQLVGVLIWLMLKNEMPAALAQQALLNYDYDLDGDINAGDLTSVLRLLGHILEHGGIDVQNLPAVVPKPCCNDRDSELPEKPKVSDISCTSDLEILSVTCYDSEQVEQARQKKGDKGGETSGDIRTAGVVGVGYGAVATDKEDCGDTDSTSTDDSGYGYMVIEVGLKNSTTISGFQFDVGFNKFSTAPASKFAIDMNPSLSAQGWKYSHKVCDDRFGYDKLVRIVSYQALGVNYSPKGYDILDTEWYDSAQQLDSIQPSDESLKVIRIVISNAQKTTCECPSKKYYIAQSLDSVKMQNSDQISNPDLYAVGSEWNGPTVYSAGKWWTASAMGGEMIRDSSSVLLHVEWSGIKIMNKRAVTNQELYAPQHEHYGSLYYGHYAGLLARIPNSYDNYPTYYVAALAYYVDKALHNGLDLGYNREKSRYEYLWEQSYKNVVAYLDTYQEAIGGPSLTDEQKQKILDGFLEDDYKGYTDDSNLDGKFDVADVVALYNSARMRYYGIFYKNKESYDEVPQQLWRKPPTTNWDWAFVNEGDGETFTYVDTKMQSGEKHNFVDFPNFQRIVPTYCLNTICTSTMSDLCPDICGSMKPESIQTLKEDAGAFSLIGFGERTDIEPNLGAELKLVFSNTPQDQSTIVLIDAEGNRASFKFGTAANGTLLTGGYISVRINSMANTLSNFKTQIEANLNMSCVLEKTFNSSSNDTIIITQESDGGVGNTSAIMNDIFKSRLVRYKTKFTNGVNFLTNLPNTFRSWAEYFYDLYNIQVSDLYKNENLYRNHGASFVPLELRITSNEKKLTDAMSYVSWSWSTIDFCKAYESTAFDISGEGEPRVKVLPGDGFTMCEVFDGDTGSRLVPISTPEYNNYYKIPTHGKVSILSHNFKTVGGVEKFSQKPNLENCDRFAPITMDGGKLITAKLFVSPMPKWSDGKFIELIDGHNDALNEPSSAFASSYAPLAKFSEIANTESNTLSVGPRSSEYTQNYAEDSASLITDADYMLHTQITGPRTILVKYNTMKPIKYVSFSIRAKNASSEIESISCPKLDEYDDYKGWTFSHTFNQNKQNVPGLPRLPSNYANDGYSVVTISAAGSFGSSNGVSNPESFQGMGNLCYINFKEDICGPIPILMKEYICPPIGNNNLKYPERQVSEVVDEKSKSIDTKYPEGSYEDKKYHNPTSKEASTIQVFNYDSSNLDSGQMKLDITNSAVNTWYPMNFGEALSPHGSNLSHRPIYSLGSGDARKSVFFDGTKGLSASGNANTLIGMNKWTIFCTVKPEDVSDSGTSVMTILRTGNTANNAPQLTLELERVSGTEYKFVGKAKGKNSSNNNVENTVEYLTTPVTFSGWHIFTWTGDIESGFQQLYMDGKLVATQDVNSGFTLDWANNKPLQQPLEVYLGHDGAAGTITSSGGNLDGRIGQIAAFNEAHEADMRQKAEAFLAIKYELQQNLPFEHVGYKGDAIANGLTTAGYLSLNKVDNLTATAKTLSKASSKGGTSVSTTLYLEDLGSDRCAASWVSKNICLDKNDQTVVSQKCGKNDSQSGTNNPGGGQLQGPP